MYDYLLGTAALESNRPSKTNFVYERILAVAPGYIGARADTGRACLALGDYGRAKIEFKSVLSMQNLPPNLRSTVEQYARVAEVRGKTNAPWPPGMPSWAWAPTPISPAPRPWLKSTCRAPACMHLHRPQARKHKTTTARWAWEARSTTSWTDQWGLYGDADYRGWAYQQFSDSDYATLDGRFGRSHTGGSWLLRTGLTAGQ